MPRLSKSMRSMLIVDILGQNISDRALGLKYGINHSNVTRLRHQLQGKPGQNAPQSFKRASETHHGEEI